MKLTPGYKTCVGCVEPIIVKTVMDVIDNPLIVSLATGCMEVSSTKVNENHWNVPLIHSTFGNSAATISGIETAFKVLKKKGLKEDFKFLVIAGDGGTYDIGLQALSGALERGHNFVYVCLDNGGYMNTGGQRSSSTPYGSKTSTTPEGKITFRKDLVEIAKAHGIKYVAQTSIYDLKDLKMKAKKAFESEGPALINVLSPCTRFWRFEVFNLKKINDLAVDTCFWPSFEIEDGNYKLNYHPSKKIPLKEFLDLQGRFKGLTLEEIEIMQKEVDRRWKNLIADCSRK